MIGERDPSCCTPRYIKNLNVSQRPWLPPIASIIAQSSLGLEQPSPFDPRLERSRNVYDAMPLFARQPSQQQGQRLEHHQKQISKPAPRTDTDREVLDQFQNISQASQPLEHAERSSANRWLKDDMSIPLSLSTAFKPLSDVCFKADNFLQCPIEPTNESSDSYPPPFVHHLQNEFVNQEGQRPVKSKGV